MDKIRETVAMDKRVHNWRETSRAGGGIPDLQLHSTAEEEALELAGTKGGRSISDGETGVCARDSRWQETQAERGQPSTYEEEEHSEEALSHDSHDLTSAQILSYRIICSTPFAVTSYVLLWYVPDGNISDIGKILWYLVFYCLFQTLQTLFHVPYSALTMFISTDQKERDSATAYRMTVEVLGTVLGTAIQGQIVGGADAPCIHKNGMNSSISTIDVNSTQYNHNSSISQLKSAYMMAAGVIGGVYVLCTIILFAGVQEREEPRNRKAQKSYSFWKGLKLVMSHGPYVKLIIGFLFTSLAFMLLEGNYALYCSYTLGFPNDFQNILLVIMLSATLTIPFWQWFLTRFGKKTAVYFGILSAVPFLILNVLVRSNLIIAYVVSFASGVSVAAAFLLPWSMLPDVIDDFKLKNPESVGHEAIFYSFYVFFTKFASGVSLGISTLSLDFAGYQTRGCDQPDAVHLTLKMLVAPAPIFLIILGLIIFKLYPIDEEIRMKNRKALEDLRDNGNDTETDSNELCSNV
ncbi:sodium-dependent lysophosphatidylcholine symporter 1-B isoform X2 [Heterodontus francisci]|uniref:sodium-dependent lysophosphatidylcholine symporter 1-B isoform X2 n=1 Tax=Heterodontus francisci TaxID=7792 RepID=UPI00355AD9DF